MYDIIYLLQCEDTVRFDALKRRYPHAKILRGTADPLQAIDKARSMAYTEMFWMISDEIDLPDTADLSWKPPQWDRQYLHGWRCAMRDGQLIDGAVGAYLVPRRQPLHGDYFDEIKIVDQWISVARPFDVVFMSYRESNADENFSHLVSCAPHAKRVDGVKGISNAHRRCAELATTSMFYTVDADTVVDKSWDFSFQPPLYDRKYLHIWHSRNPINDLQYGWGGIKLWPRHAVLDFSGNWLDFTTTVGNIKIVPHVISTSAFNADAASAWRSGFREAVKLVFNVRSGDQSESLERLMIWITAATDAENAAECRRGAIMGMQFAIRCIKQSDREQARMINDFDQLAALYLQQRDMQMTNYNRRDVLDQILGA